MHPFFQNNNRGGYNVGDATADAADSENEQYNMVSIAYLYKILQTVSEKNIQYIKFSKRG